MKRINILIVEDETKYHDQFKRILGTEKYNVKCTATGETALKKLQTKNFDLVILDLVLKKGKMSGLETLEKINKINSSILIALTSAYANDNQISEAILNRKAHTYISKPLNQGELIQTVKSAIKWKKTSYKIANKNINTIIQLHEQSIMKRCLLTNSLFCPLQVEEEINLVFVGMPFNDKKLKQIYHKAIEPALESHGFKSWRADEELSNIAIICKICQKIQASKYCIFDLTSWNANVMFELGIALGLAKRCLLLKSFSTKIPTDLKGFEYIEFDSDDIKLKSNIVKYFNRIIEKSTPQKIRQD